MEKGNKTDFGSRPLGRAGEGPSSRPLGRVGGGPPSFHWADPSYYNLLKQFARENRHNMTLGERCLWNQLKGNALGVKFLRQYIIGTYIADFASLDARLVIEVDGGYHAEPRQKEDDVHRQQWLEEHGFHVLRFTNEEVEFETNKIVSIIKTFLLNLES